MKILFNVSPAVRPVRGIGTYAKELIRHLLKIDTQNHYIIFSVKSPFANRRASFSCPESKNASYRSIIFPYKPLNLLWNNLNLFPIERLVGEIDILHSLDRIAPFTKKAKIIITIHDMAWYISWAADKRKKLIYKQILQTLERSSAIIAVSEFSKNEIIKYLSFLKEKIHVVNSGVSDRFHPIDKKEISEEINKKYPWDDYILYLGTLNDPRKNVELIVASYASLKKRNRIKERLILCGDIGKYSRNLLMLIKKINLPDDILIYTRWIPDADIPYIYNKARIVLFPSLYEGFGFPILESMACGRPIITSNIAPLRELASDAAILVDPRDQQGLANSIGMLLSDEKLYNLMVEKGLKRSREFTWIRTAQETLKLYEKVYKEERI